MTNQVDCKHVRGAGEVRLRIKPIRFRPIYLIRVMPA